MLHPIGGVYIGKRCLSKVKKGKLACQAVTDVLPYTI